MAYCSSQPQFIHMHIYSYIHTRTHTCMHTLACIYRHKFLGKNVHKLCEKTHEINQQWLPTISSPAGGNRGSPKFWMLSLKCNMWLPKKVHAVTNYYQSLQKTYESTYNSSCVLYKYSLSKCSTFNHTLEYAVQNIYISQQCYYVWLIFIIMTVVHHIF
jgi:hypothetical protein